MDFAKTSGPTCLDLFSSLGEGRVLFVFWTVASSNSLVVLPLELFFFFSLMLLCRSGEGVVQQEA